jgi:hypothetical protein
MNGKKGMIFRGNYPHFIVLIVVITVISLIAFRQVRYGALLIILILPVFLTVWLMFTCLSITISQRGITGHHLFKNWNFAWHQITGWNPLEIEKGKSTIFFRTGANVYQIRQGLFSEEKIQNLIACFEKYCGQPLKGEARIRPVRL